MTAPRATVTNKAESLSLAVGLAALVGVMVAGWAAVIMMLIFLLVRT